MKHYSTYQSQFIEMFGQVSEESPRLNDIAHVYDGTHKTPTYTNSGIPFISVENISDVYGSKKYISKDDYDLYKHKPEYGDIFMTRIGSIGKCAVYESHDPLAYYVSLALIKPNKDIVHPKFLKYYIESTDGTLELKKRSLLKAFPMKINLGEIGKIKVIVPAKDKQLEFVKVAEQADKSKFSNLKSQFIEMFEGDKYPRISLDAIADEWIKGQAFKKDEICANGDKHCIHYGELFTKYGPVIKEVVSKTSVDLKKPSKNGDILFPASDVTPNGLARCSMLPYDNVVLGGDIIVLRPKEGYSPAYLSYAINQQTTQLLARVNGGLVKHLSAKGLKTVEIPIPSKEKQEEYIRIAEQADKSKLIQNTLLNNKLKFCYCYTPRHISS